MFQTATAQAICFIYDFATNTETQITRDGLSDDTPHFSPDGKMIAFERGGAEIRVYEIESKTERSVAKAHLERPPLSSDRPYAWSPDSKWIAYVPVGDKLFKNVYRRAGCRRRSPPDYFRGERRQQHHFVESGRHLHSVRHGPAH